MKYIYPAIFTEETEGGYSVDFPDIENTIIQKYRSSDDLTKAMVRRTLGIE